MLYRLPGFHQWMKLREDVAFIKYAVGHPQSSTYLMDRQMMIENYLNKNLFENAKYQDPLRLNQYENQVYSESGEDGIVQEIFKRIGTTNRFFVEFGAGDGMCNTTTYLFLKGWEALWIEGDPDKVKKLRNKFRQVIDQGRLEMVQARITPDNIESIFETAKIPHEPDVMSICIDGNDYWIWKAIGQYRPRVLMIEYNSLFPPEDKFVMTYNAEHAWHGTNYFGSSLKSLELLGESKGYCLVGCNFSGVRAFFVRKDLVEDKFLKPYTSENHYQQPRYFLNVEKGHARDFGSFERV
jgi:hypothetical protein